MSADRELCALIGRFGGNLRQAAEYCQRTENEYRELKNRVLLKIAEELDRERRVRISTA
jgi:hypothetical protein